MADTQGMEARRREAENTKRQNATQDVTARKSGNDVGGRGRKGTRRGR